MQHSQLAAFWTVAEVLGTLAVFPYALAINPALVAQLPLRAAICTCLYAALPPEEAGWEVAFALMARAVPQRYNLKLALWRLRTQGHAHRCRSLAAAQPPHLPPRRSCAALRYALPTASRAPHFCRPFSARHSAAIA